MSTQIETTNTQVAVLGATGKVGSQVIRSLSDAGIPSKALTRNLSKTTPVPLVEWVEGDLTDTIQVASCSN